MAGGVGVVGDMIDEVFWRIAEYEYTKEKKKGTGLGLVKH